MLSGAFTSLKTMNVKKLNDMIQDIKDMNDLILFGLTEEETEGYLEFFAINIIKPLSTVFGYEI